MDIIVTDQGREIWRWESLGTEASRPGYQSIEVGMSLAELSENPSNWEIVAEPDDGVQRAVETWEMDGSLRRFVNR